MRQFFELPHPQSAPVPRLRSRHAQACIDGRHRRLPNLPQLQGPVVEQDEQHPVARRAPFNDPETLTGLGVMSVSAPLDLDALRAFRRPADGVVSGRARRYEFQPQRLRRKILRNFACDAERLAGQLV
jgi:hypothetical protein